MHQGQEINERELIVRPCIYTQDDQRQEAFVECICLSSPSSSSSRSRSCAFFNNLPFSIMSLTESSVGFWPDWRKARPMSSTRMLSTFFDTFLKPKRRARTRKKRTHCLTSMKRLLRMQISWFHGRKSVTSNMENSFVWLANLFVRLSLHAIVLELFRDWPIRNSIFVDINIRIRFLDTARPLLISPRTICLYLHLLSGADSAAVFASELSKSGQDANIKTKYSLAFTFSRSFVEHLLVGNRCLPIIIAETLQKDEKTKISFQSTKIVTRKSTVLFNGAVTVCSMDMVWNCRGVVVRSSRSIVWRVFFYSSIFLL